MMFPRSSTVITVSEAPMFNAPEADSVTKPFLRLVKSAGKEYAENGTLSKETLDRLSAPMIPHGICGHCKWRDMSKIKSESSLTVLFEEPFWVGILERSDGKKYEVCKIVFGGEPTDGEIYEFLLRNYNKLRFSRPVSAKPIEDKRINPKRMQRIIKKQTGNTGVGTKAQQALALEREQNKLERKTKSREQKEAEKELRFEQKQKKKKENKKGH